MTTSLPLETKGKSPFYPGQPVPVELFVGRRQQIEHILTRGVGQVALGKPTTSVVQGEYGIGKSSIAGFLQSIAERDYGLHVLYVPVGGADTLEDIGALLLEATLRSGAINPTRAVIGDAAFWIDKDGTIDKEDAFQALIVAAEEVGKKYVDQQILKALRSKDYKSILVKIAKTGFEMSFNRSTIAADLTDDEKRKFNNFLQKMKRLGVIRLGESTGEWVFVVRMVRLFIWLDHFKKTTHPQAGTA